MACLRAAFLAILIVCSNRSVAGADTDVSGAVGDDAVIIRAGSSSDGWSGDAPFATGSTPTQVVDCGVRPVTSGLPECKHVGIDCTSEQAAAPAGVVVAAMVTYTLERGVYVQTSESCAARVPGVPGLGESDVRAEVVRLVPLVGVRAAPSGVAVVGLESLLWVDTAAVRDLGSVVLLGHRVAISVVVSGVRWDFGDGVSGVSAGPGRPFTGVDRCGRVQCPGWFGHTYRRTGVVVVSAVVQWSASYRVDGGGGQQVVGVVAGPVAVMRVVVKQARAVLVPTPTR